MLCNVGGVKCQPFLKQPLEMDIKLMGQGRSCACIEGNSNSNCCGLVLESKIKSFRKVTVKSLQ